MSANGHTLRENDVWNNYLRSDGSVVRRGLTAHIHGPDGGIVVRDAGWIEFDPQDQIVHVSGPHDQLSGKSFCPWLSP